MPPAALPRKFLAALPLLLLNLGAWACTDPEPAEPTPVPSVAPSATAVPPTATPEVAPTLEPSPTPVQELSAGEAIIVGGIVRTRTEPNSTSEQLGLIGEGQPVTIAERLQGENWLLGSQTWLSSTPEWASEWFRLEDGSYIYGPFVFILREGEVSPIAPVPEGQAKWIDVDISEQVARAMVGEEVRFTAPMSSGAPPFGTPMGSFAVEPDGRLEVERMTASQAGYQPDQATYDVERVLFTQYFDRMGNALHLNYWRPASVFGSTPTSHGCIGLQLHEAQYLWLFAEPGTRVEIHE